MPTKKCSKCHAVKLGTEFTKNIANKDGLNSWCRICHNATSNLSRIKPPSMRKDAFDNTLCLQFLRG